MYLCPQPVSWWHWANGADARRPRYLPTCFCCPENLCLTLLPPLVPDPFSLLAFPAKFFEGVVYTLCLHFLSTHSRVNPLQSGFQATGTVLSEAVRRLLAKPNRIS